MSSEQLLASGQRFVDRYTIEEIVGTGGFSQVFRATTAEGRTVAVKVLLPKEKAGPNQSYPDSLVDRFVREARLLERLRDPFTIDLYDHGRSAEGHLYMVFEFLRGRELFDIVKNEGKQPYQRVAHVLRQTLRGLQSAHALGILHRDIKPNNIMLVKEADGKERVKVLDFGIAKMYGEDSQAAGNDLTAQGVLVGTPRYMSPEQLRAGQLGPASDIYSLGIVAIEMLTGRKAIRGKDRIDIITQQLSPKKFAIPQEIPCPRDLRNIVLRMVEKNVHARYQSAAQVLRDLDQWQVGAAEGRTIVEVVSAAEIHTPRAETATPDEDTNVHRISVSALNSIDPGKPAPTTDHTIAESEIDTHSQPSLQARMGTSRSGQFPRSHSDSFNRVDTGMNPPDTDMSHGDLDATFAANSSQDLDATIAATSSQDLDATLAADSLRAATDLPDDAMATIESNMLGRPAPRPPTQWPTDSDMGQTVEQHSRTREELLAAARTSEHLPQSSPDKSHLEIPQFSTDLPVDQTSSSASNDLSNTELIGILLSIPLPGIGHIILGQKAKGIVIFALLIITLGLLYLAALAVAFDAFLVVRASRKREVGPWEFFPDFGDLLS